MKAPFLSTQFSESGKRAKRRFENILNHNTKRTGALILMCAIVLVGVINLLVNVKSAEEKRLAILTDDSQIFLDSAMTAPAEILSKNDLVYVYYKHNDDLAYIRRYDGNQPTLEGYIPTSVLSYDFERANQVLIATDNLYSASDESSLLSNTSAQGLICNVVEYSDGSDWIMIIRPGDTERLWVKKSDISYDIVLDYDEQLPDSFYKQVKQYLQKEYADTYKPYYDATVVKKLNNYREAYDKKTKTLEATFTMNTTHRNRYKDPDTVKYIQDAKRLAKNKEDEYYQKLYETYHNEYNQIIEGNYILKLTAKVSDGKLNTDSIRLYNNSAGKGEAWVELENGFEDYIID